MVNEGYVLMETLYMTMKLGEGSMRESEFKDRRPGHYFKSTQIRPDRRRRALKQDACRSPWRTWISDLPCYFGRPGIPQDLAAFLAPEPALSLNPHAGQKSVVPPLQREKSLAAFALAFYLA